MKKFHLAAGFDPATVQLIADTQAVQNAMDAAMGNTTTAAAMAGALRMVAQQDEIDRLKKWGRAVDTYPQIAQVKVGKALGYLDTMPDAMRLAENQTHLDQRTGGVRAIDAFSRPDKAAIAAASGCMGITSAQALRAGKLTGMGHLASVNGVAEAMRQAAKVKACSVTDYLGTAYADAQLTAQQKYLVDVTGVGSAASVMGALDKTLMDAANGYIGSASAKALMADQRLDPARQATASSAVAFGQLDKAVLDDAAGLLKSMTVADVFKQVSTGELALDTVKQFYEKAEEPKEFKILEVPYVPMYDFQAAENRRRKQDRVYAIETARLAKLAELKVQDEYEAAKLASDAIKPDEAELDAPVEAVPAKRPVQRAAAQDAAIFAVLKTMALDPLALPKNQPGKPGVKAKMRTALKGDALFVGSTVFDKAWERLSSRREIVIRV